MIRVFFRFSPLAVAVFFYTPVVLTKCLTLHNWQGSIVVFDAAYAPFIRTPGVPKSIFEIEGARSCCIEVR